MKYVYYICNDVYYILNDVYYILNDVYYIRNDVYYIRNDVYYVHNDVYYIRNNVYYVFNDIYYTLNNIYYLCNNKECDYVWFSIKKDLTLPLILLILLLNIEIVETTTNEMPHNGNRLRKYIKESGKRITRLSKDMGYAFPALTRMCDTESVRTHIWWELGLRINRNIFAEFGEIFPVEYKSKREQKLEAELADVKKELEIYRRILDKERR